MNSASAARATVPLPHRPDVSPVVDDADSLPDGVSFGFVRSVDAAAGTLQFDLAQAFLRPAAASAESEDGAEQLDGYVRKASTYSSTAVSDVLVTRVVVRGRRSARTFA